MKKIIRKAISSLANLYRILTEAYIDTYGDEILAEELKERISEIQEINKAKYIGFAAGVYANEASKKGIIMTQDTAVGLAHKSFIDSLLKDELDELYNIKGEGNESD